MQKLAWLVCACVCVVVAAAAFLIVFSLEPEAVAAPPLSIEHLLDEELPVADEKQDEEVLADNSACYVCHGNYDGEPLALIHAREDVGCADCHGESHDHRNDEDNIIPPDKMYATGDIAGNCATCHETHDAPANEVIALWQERCPAKTDPKKLVCTDCHGEHRLKFRTVWWDKKTGKLVVRDEGQRTKAAKDLTKQPPAEKKE